MEEQETTGTIIGIDLGTTNSAVSYVDLEDDSGDRPKIRTFQIPQATGVGEVSSLSVLPSFLYLPGNYDLPRDAVKLPWGSADETFVGAFARDHGSDVPSRLVSSAKSWLCNDQVNRHARILPWGADAEIPKVSPVRATSAYLSHIRSAWNHRYKEDPDRWMENQRVIVTVPASFDEVARELTLEAARLAGLHRVTLLEEPVAVFYAWLNRHENNWAEKVKTGELILVCDVGGGTTDFTLIVLTESDGSPRFERLAVGNHLILGGDNMDLAVSRAVEKQLGPGAASLSGDRWKTLYHQGRLAKEAILGGETERFPVTVVGGGSKLIAGTLKTTLDKQTVENIVLEGFFPMTDPEPPRRFSGPEGVSEFGLPYESEQAITRQLGWFMERHKDTVKRKLGRDSHAPDWILFNGGALKPDIIQKRIRASVSRWFQLPDVNCPGVMSNPTPDLSVALGAAYYGLVKTGFGVRVGTGSARSFYVGVADKEAGAAAQFAKKAICLVERGMEEGTTIDLEDRQFDVLANRPVSFDLYSSSYRADTTAGEIVDVDESLTPLPPIKTVVEYGKKNLQVRIPVQLEATYTEMGTLAIWCKSTKTSHRWQLQFQLREAETPLGLEETRVLEASVVEAAVETARSAFLDSEDGSVLETLPKNIAETLSLEKNHWPLSFLRQLADGLLKLMKARGKTALAESRWLNLVGFCLRPGFGAGFDDQRVRHLFSIYNQGPVFSKKPSVRNEWWIMWRRVAGGLKAGQQRAVVQDLASTMLPSKGKKIRIPVQEQVEIWMAVANMERLGVQDKVRWGRRLLKEIQAKKVRQPLIWSLSRLGARQPLYGPVDCIVAPDEVSGWIDQLLSRQWPSPKPIQIAFSQMARKTGDRMRDLDETICRRVLSWMEETDAPESCRKPVEKLVALDRTEETQIFGESLPTGLVLRPEG